MYHYCITIVVISAEFFSTLKAVRINWQLRQL